MEETLVEVDERNSYDKSSDETCIVVVLSSLVAVCGYYAFGNAVGYSSPAESGIVDDFSLTVTQYSFFASMLSIGAMLGALLSGKLADLIGRRKAMAVSDALCILGWLVIASARSPLWLYIGRFCVGCGIGLLSYMVPVYIAEITSKNVRGTFTSLSQLMLGCAQALLNVIGSFINWRTLALIGLIPSLIQVLLLLFIPESPRWLVKIGRVEQFEASLQRLRGKNADISQEAADIKAYTERLAQIQEEGILALFQWKYTYPVIVGVGLMVFQQFGGLNGFTFYTASIFESAGFPSSTGIITAAVAQILMTVLGVVLIDKCGRRLLLLISVSGMCLGCILTGLSFFLEDLALETEISSGLVITGVVVFLGFFNLGMGGIPWIIMSEIFPISIKGAAGSLVTLVSWVGSWVVSCSFSFLFEWSSTGTFFIFGGVCGCGIVFISKLVPESTGRALEEIQASLLEC